MQSRFVRGLAVLACLLWATGAAAQVPSFSGLGDLTGGLVGSDAFGISADGQVVVGSSEGANGTEAFRWTPVGGISGLGFLSMVDPLSTANAVSDDGLVIAGTSNDSGAVLRAFRWSASTMTALNRFSCTNCDPETKALGLSGDGLVVVGSALARSGSGSSPHLDPVRWPSGGTGISDLGNLGGGIEAGSAQGASQTGSTIVGSHFSGNGKDAWYWTGSGLNVLPTIIGGSIIGATAYAISDDGSTIVGYSNKSTLTLPNMTVVATDLQAVRWTGGGYGTLTQLGDFPGAVSTDSTALAVSSDGSIIVGRAVDASVSDRAFIWDATNGMRNLKTVLISDYGLDLENWILTEATAVSDVVGGDFYVAGRGTNPQGETEGWVAFLSVPACSDGLDNDSDLQTDYPNDPGCTSAVDWSEENDCEDGLDNDGDGDIDHPADGDCRSASDPSEQPDCSDGLDNDGDLLVDFPADPGCASAAWQLEDPACNDGLDNDSDTDTDFPADSSCNAAWDLSEVPDCNDGLDNDADGDIDHPSDLECDSPTDESEAPQCSDGVDNDLNGKVDHGEDYPGCDSPDDPIEAPQCGDGIDNDGDLLTDHPSDPECSSATDVSENPVTFSVDDLIVVDRESKAVFRVDTGTGVQTLISEGGLLTEPQGIAQRLLEVVVADPAGLVTVAGTGEQRLASPPLVANESLQVVFDELFDPLVLEADQISVVTWSDLGIGAKSEWMPMPTPELFPVINLWIGDSIAVEQGGDLVTSAGSVYGDGIYRIDHTDQTPTILKMGVENVAWLDLAIESDDTILAAGFKYAVATGIYRIDPSTGDSTPLNNSYAWQKPTGVAISSTDDIYVADAGICAESACSGGQIVHVDPLTGTATQLSTGGYIQGEMDLILLPEPRAFPLLLSGLLALVLLHARRTTRD